MTLNGLPMGAVGVFDKEDGILSAGLAGFDLNCGINILRSDLTKEEITPKLNDLINKIFENVPCGVGAKGKVRVGDSELESVMLNGVKWAVENGYAVKEDLDHMEENGCMKGAETSKVSDKAKKRGKPQLGSLGAGNHFLEIQSVSDIYDDETAKAFGLTDPDQVLIMVHCGSRGFGHQVATDYLKIQGEAAKKYGIKLPDPQLVCAPTTSPEGQAFFGAMKCAVNYAFTNRQMIAHWIRESFEQVLGKDWETLGLRTIYSVAHNVIKEETHTINGEKREVYVHRKGATRAFPAGHPLVPEAYRKVGQPVLIAGTMGTSSYILKGTETGMSEAFGSTCHGAGRCMSRHAAIKKFYGEDVQKSLADKGISAKSTHPKVLAEEAPGAYKDVDMVIDSVHNAGISTKVARVIPLAVAKG